MAGKVLKGIYGYYYQYVDENNKKKNLSIFDNVYTDYYSAGYLTDDHLDQIVQGKTVTFTVPKKSKSGDITVTAKLIPYTRKDGKETKIIEFETDLADDSITITAKSKDLLESYYSKGNFNWDKPQKLLDTLDLSVRWKTWSENKKYGNNVLFSIVCYRANVRHDKGIKFYGTVENDQVLEIDEVKFVKLKSEYEIEAVQQKVEHDRIQEEMRKVKEPLITWLYSLQNIICPYDGQIDIPKFIEYADTLMINVPNLEDRIVGMLNSKSSYKLTVYNYFYEARREICNINESNYTDTSIVTNIKTKLLNNIKTLAEYYKTLKFRDSLYEEYQQLGLDIMTIAVDIDNALDLGYFPTVQRILTKYKGDAPKYIIYNMYKEILDPDILREHILNMLKIYYDFYDMPEKDRKSIAKYVARFKLTDYYNAVRGWDEVLEILIDNSRDPKLTKPLLEGIAGTSKANVLKNKTYYFEKRGRLRDNIIIYKPIELLDELRKHIKEFNVSSNVAILTNIELDVDESFIFQFYTFADGEGDEKGFDGRRMLNLTRIYNRGKDKDHKIGFYFDNESSDNITKDDE